MLRSAWVYILEANVVIDIVGVGKGLDTTEADDPSVYVATNSLGAGASKVSSVGLLQLISSSPNVPQQFQFLAVVL